MVGSVELQGQEEESPATAIWLTAGSENGVMGRSDLTHLTTQAIGRSRPVTASGDISGDMAGAMSSAVSINTEGNSNRQRQAWIVLGAIATLGIAYTFAQIFVPNWSEQFLNPVQTPGASAQTGKVAL